MVYSKEDLFNHINTLKPDGFEALEKYFGFISLEAKRENVISLSTREYFPHGAYIHGVSAYIKFYEIEEELKPLYLAEGIKNSDKYTIKNTLVNIADVDYQFLDQEVSDDISFSKISIELKKLLNRALLFFNRFQTINAVADILAKKTPKEIVPLIQGSILFPKTILILKHTDHPRFEEKRYEFYEILKKQAAKKKQIESDLVVFEKLFEVC